MDFYRIRQRSTKSGIEVYPDFIVGRSQDLMVRSKSFYAIWDAEAGLWSTDEYDVQRLVDAELRAHAETIKATGAPCSVRYLGDFSTNSWREFRSYIGLLADSATQLDETLTFANTTVKKTDFVSRRLPYPLQEGDASAWDEIVGTLYEEEERRKIEWAIGAIISGEAKDIQKFLVFYGAMGTGKSTILNIIQALFDGYWTTFVAKELTSNSNNFALETFKKNPLVAIEHDGDLSKLQDNTKLNSLVSHEWMQINEKNKPIYSARFNAMLMMGSNNPVKITDAKSGLIRRLIDIHPSGNLLTPRRYQALMSQVHFELGAIAWHCLQVYRTLGKDYYALYRPTEMMLQTDVFFNFIEANFTLFVEQNGVSLAQAWELYKNFIEESGIEHKMAKYKLREELRNYFDHFHDRTRVDGVMMRSWYEGFRTDKFRPKLDPPGALPLVLDQTESLLDEELASYPAQYATIHETPKKRWTDVTTKLSELDTTQIHYVKPPENHIVIDFDLRDDSGEKSAEKNLEAASLWPPTYAEFSKGGGGIHLHYIWDGDVTELKTLYSEGIEIKTFTGGSSLRRRLSQCNAVPIATLNSALPKKEKKKMDGQSTIKTEKGLRTLIDRNLRKEIHPGTKPSIDFIYQILEDAYSSGLVYDVSDLKGTLYTFAARSTNQSLKCIQIVNAMKLTSEESVEDHPDSKVISEKTSVEEPKKVYFDVEVYPNLFVVCWKVEGPDSQVVKMINPSSQDIERLLGMRLVGFNNRLYDNHILYARFMGYDNGQLYELSKRIIDKKDRNALFGQAYNLSYADIYEFSSKKQSLKKFMIDLGINHMEMDIPWDEPVPDELVDKVVTYCANDVLATEDTFNARIADFKARQILASLSGLPINATTQKHTAQIVFGDNHRVQDEFIYTDLSEMFPGYVYDAGVSTYRGETVGEGGYVHAEPGVYRNVALLDIASMHPTSIEQLDLFGPYTDNFSALKQARIAIKHEDFDSARKMLDGKLAPYLDDPEQAEALSYALKIVINIVYGLTSASFPNPFRDNRNKDNIVAKRGALFMIDLKNFVQEQGFSAVHIKTDSIKIPNATDQIIEDIMEFGSRYGYEFEHEATYEKMALVNDAVYIARYGWAAKQKLIGTWTAVGAQFAHPYVFKTLFTGEDLEFSDYCETKQVSKGHMVLEFNNGEEKVRKFIGRIGRFVPVVEGSGGVLYRVHDGKDYAVTGTKGYLWKDAEVVQSLDEVEMIDVSYFENLVEEAKETIGKYEAFSVFIDEQEPLPHISIPCLSAECSTWIEHNHADDVCSKECHWCFPEFSGEESTQKQLTEV